MMPKIDKEMYLDFFLSIKDESIEKVTIKDNKRMKLIVSDIAIFISHDERKIKELIVGNLVIFREEDLKHKEKEIENLMNWLFTESKFRVKFLFR